MTVLHLSTYILGVIRCSFTFGSDLLRQRLSKFMFLFSLTEQRVVRALLQALIKSFLFKYSSHNKFCLHTIDYCTHWASPPSDEAAAANPKKTRKAERPKGQGGQITGHGPNETPRPERDYRSMAYRASHP